MSKDQVYATCPKCKSLISYKRAKDIELEACREAEKTFQKAVRDIVKAGREERERRNIVEINLRKEIKRLKDQLENAALRESDRPGD